MIKILVVDDMSQWRNFHTNALSTILQNVEHSITTKDRATDAFQDILENKSTPYDLIISDLQMETDYEPEHAGEWLVRNTLTLKEYKNTKIIMASAAFNIKTIAENLGVSYLRKASIVNTPLTYQLAIKEALHI